MPVPLSTSTPPPAPAPAPILAPRRRHHPLVPLVELHSESLPHLKAIHARALRTSSSDSQDDQPLLFLFSRLLLHSSKLSLPYASLLLSHLPSPLLPNSFCFNALIRAHSRTPLALLTFRRMLLLSCPPDRHTFPFLLSSCAFLFALPLGLQAHSLALKLALSQDPFVANSLLHFYSSCALLPRARQLFDRMPTRTQVSWNAMIDAYATARAYDAALSLFRQMQAAAFAPDVFTLQSVLRACTGLGALSLGMWAHAFLLRQRCQEDVLVSNSLIDLYSRCGSVDLARQVFSRMLARDVASYNAMILGLAMHGCVDESLNVFRRMLSEVDGLRPNGITFVAVLSACNHGGLVSEGRRYFERMVGEFGIEPELEHYGCVVDLLARKGFIEEALQLVRGMPFKPDAVIWRSLLDACCKNNAGMEVSESVARRVVESEEVAASGGYVLVSRLYASANRWNDVGLVRKMMSDRGIRKEPGCSSIEVDGSVHEFVAGDTSHPRSKEIYEKLDEVECELAGVGYRPDSSQAPTVAGIDNAKLESLRLHSERLAIAFGLLNVRKGMPIRILKNLRICGDCHAITKLISRVYQVEIVVRDRTRFHHFRDGSCSCMDYW